MSERSRAVLVAVQLPQVSTEALDSSLAELGRLCDTLGFDVVGQVTQKRDGTGSAKLLGDGKLAELASWTGGPGFVHRGPRNKKAVEEDPDADVDALFEGAEGQVPAERRADVVCVDHDLSPSQLRNLQSASGVEVFDRTGIILEIFHRHARSREARLQVEIARLAYMAPRLREMGGPSERQGGGIGGKGSGESQLELDKRRVRDRISQLRKDLADIEAERGSRRSRRRTARQVALVGYTNAGKSSLVRALTGSDLLIADQLFATLDTTVRRLQPEVIPPVLVTDTVGFIRDLPHDLVASFRSTLEAALDATLLLHVVDAADPSLEDQLEVTADVLRHIQADEIPRQLVLNKCDKLSADQQAELLDRYPSAWLTSAHDPEQVAALHERIVSRFAEDLEEADVFVPWSRADALGLVRMDIEVLDEQFENEGVRYRLRGTPIAIGRLRAAVA